MPLWIFCLNNELLPLYIVFQECICEYTNCLNNELLPLYIVFQECICEYTQCINNELLLLYIVFQECICEYTNGKITSCFPYILCFMNAFVNLLTV